MKSKVVGTVLEEMRERWRTKSRGAVRGQATGVIRWDGLAPGLAKHDAGV